MHGVPVKYLPYLGLLLAALLWSSSFIALKLAFMGYDPMVVIFGRMIIATFVFLLLYRYLKGVKYRRQDLKYLVLMAFCEPCLYFIFEAKALEHTSASQAGMVTSVMPLLVAVLAWIFLKEHIRAKTVLGFVIAIMGVCILSFGSNVTANAPNPVLGNFLEFLAMLTCAGYTVTLKKLSSNYTPLFLSAIQAFIGSVFFFPFLFFAESVIPTQISAVPTFAIIFLGVFVTFGAYGSYNYAVSKIPANQAASFINLIPAFTVIQGYLILNDQLTVIQGIAILFVFIGVFVSQQLKTKRKGNESKTSG